MGHRPCGRGASEKTLICDCHFAGGACGITSNSGFIGTQRAAATNWSDGAEGLPVAVSADLSFAAAGDSVPHPVPVPAEADHRGERST
mmetsp:Transcript_27627/g.60409  ORF Transcript_27627/g.60409 Transcript_27627/m.60409 type:complete len:88 (-) Transcript_27627:1499-1762(-)